MLSLAAASLLAASAAAGAADSAAVAASVAANPGLVVETLQEAPACERAFEEGFRGVFRYELVDRETDEVLMDNRNPETFPYGLRYGATEEPLAFDLGVEGMCEGETRRIVAPPGLGPPRRDVGDAATMEFTEVLLERVSKLLTAPEEELWMALQRGNSLRVQELLDEGVSPNAQEPVNGMTPILHAVARNNMELFAILMNARGDERVDLNLATHSGHVPIIYASGADNQYMLEALLLRGADPNVAIETGETALHFAAQAHIRENIDLLRFHGADVTAETNEGLRPIDYAKVGSVQRRLKSSGEGTGESSGAVSGSSSSSSGESTGDSRGEEAGTEL